MDWPSEFRSSSSSCCCSSLVLCGIPILLIFDIWKKRRKKKYFLSLYRFKMCLSSDHWSIHSNVKLRKQQCQHHDPSIPTIENEDNNNMLPLMELKDVYACEKKSYPIEDLV